MEYTVYYNGELMRSSEVPLSIFDHGFLFGDGVRVSMRVYNRRPLMFKEHLADFFYSLEKLDIKVTLSEKVIEKTIRVLLDLNSLKNAVVTFIATRGDAHFNFSPHLKTYPRVIIMVNPPPAIDEEIRYKGIHMAISDCRTITKAIFDRQIFTLSNQYEVYNLYEARKKNCFEGLMVNIEGYVCEGTRSNIFIVENGNIFTPDIESGVRNRGMRKLVMKLAKHMDYEVYEGFLSLKKLFQAKECFVTGTELEILPVVGIEGKPIGNGVPGKITCQLIQSFKKFTDHDTLDLDHV